MSRLCAEALAAALATARATNGDVDPTCGRSLIGIGYDRDFTGLRRAPFGPGLAAGRSGVPAAGWWTVQLDLGRRTVRLPDGVLLDLGASAKALAADRRITEASGGTLTVGRSASGGGAVTAGFGLPPQRPGGAQPQAAKDPGVRRCGPTAG